MAEETQAAAPEAPVAPTPTEEFNAIYDVGADEPPPIQAESIQPGAASDAASAAPAPFQHPAYLVRMAQQQGLTADDIQSIPSNALGVMVDRMQQRQMEIMRAQPRAQPQQTVPPPPEPEEEVDLGLSQAETDLFNPELIAVLKKVAKAPLKEVKALKKELAETRQQTQSQKVAEETRQLDALFRKYPELTPILGKGTGQQVKDTDARAFQERLEVLRGLEILKDQGTSLEERYDAVVKLRDSNLLQGKRSEPELSPEDKKLEANLAQRRKDWEQAGVAQPTARKTPPLPEGRQKAIESVSRLVAERKAPEQSNNNSNGHATLDDFLP